ncbi:hypothetical protein A2J03_17590 [Rhodococcus sp. EPR-157]|uniref:alcohol dehydrogenase catalytic domain-containing protein n=1 Tax=Rhodococcus sp. EPR-157 TaxID=1813677 RepID=UPI0007BB8BD7|nr:alcohol dehydrogenase catalytic domain-containing protein [Rhodococcus sp. EPR-157]KZF12596.1 hypothetical protein A2J03_17590 [Rhodococcus sp. EPR-157]
MNVARLVAPGEPFELGTATKPTPGPKDVLVKVAACGLVPNSYNVVNGKTPFVPPALPAIFGLDVSGTIEAVGEQVLGIEVGQRVYVDPHLVCGSCHDCRRGSRDMCQFGCLRAYFAGDERSAQLMNQYPVGGLSEYVVAPDYTIATLPDEVDLLTAARFGYLGTSFGALRRGAFGPGQTLLVNGVTGTLGVAAVAIALGMGATKILGVGRNPELLEQVSRLAPGRVETASSEDGTDVVEWALERTHGRGVDVMYDCLGVGGDGNSTNALMAAVKTAGHAVLAAGGVDIDIVQPYLDVLGRDVPVLGSNWFSPGEIDEMIAMIAAGVIDLSILENREFALTDVNDAFDFVGSRPGGFINVVVVPERQSPR